MEDKRAKSYTFISYCNKYKLSLFNILFKSTERPSQPAIFAIELWTKLNPEGVAHPRGEGVLGGGPFSRSVMPIERNGTKWNGTQYLGNGKCFTDSCYVARISSEGGWDLRKRGGGGMV